MHYGASRYLGLDIVLISVLTAQYGPVRKRTQNPRARLKPETLEP